MTVELKLQIQLKTSRRISEQRLNKVVKAVTRAIEYTLDNDVADAEILNRDDIVQVTVKPL